MPTFVALVAALGGPPLLVIGTRWFFDGSPPFAVSVVLQLVYCGFAVFVLWTVLERERRPLASIGLRKPRWSTLAAGAGLWLISFALLPVVMRPVYEWAGAAPAIGVRALLAEPLWFRLVQAMTGGIVEELLYRGYAIERLSMLTERRWLAVALASLAFGLAHAPGWGVRYALVADLPFGILASLWYVWRRDLIANMLAHDVGLIVGVLSISA